MSNSFTTKPKHLIVIVGPTAIGKTACSIQLAEALQTEILSVDSRQFYRDLVIGTAQPTPAEMRSIPHHFLSFLPIQETYTAGRFAKEALQKLDGLFSHHNVVIATGGSGLYLKALCEGLAEIPPLPTNLRTTLNSALAEKGLPYLTQLLAAKDPTYYNIVDLNNPKRVIRALEVCLGTGIPYSTLRKQVTKTTRPFNTITIGLAQEKTALHKRINLRVDAMMEQGLLQEVERLYPYKMTNALQTLGYKELFNYIDGKYSLTEAINQIKTNTQQYAKKQMTWFKKDKQTTWFTPYDLAKIEAYIGSIIG
ncbi:MAG: tRNA (adenosine(37)-N6)-dimethylallyltransferase MiaA [Candidatus Cardinium sp.]|uniref:tRNA (adenosine(37)-N6)-dimethylallyltransferase MiaA n=1 Tax=Cardinium endosymbiont of Dermatophagoides farinae TaxID=2597823 RepID=UPI001183E53E|nr:tRNA (adenosine(37)-N6)-dimethylallyltransferase MiaA [Cardinium endosymbiont of Dermatophagoides farinae]TSJ80690.1 tRNA (adenosine(37)-N6)-dimethylallyltransferase MiaA [Cardinium endosymbiont of Dermatophagoides farinae]UWW96682.1 MAG: tRNA (adenosine(37)-N6)-dimethylallyltransferase MiaA [Candidatus Cardinium sp.]